MSKSYGKYKTIGFACGSNTDFYRERRKHQRRVNNHRIRNVMAHSDIEEFDEQFVDFYIPRHDYWNEPTDGHYKMTAKNVKEKMEDDENGWYGIYITKDNKVKK